MASDLQQKLKPFLDYSLEQMGMPSFLGIFVLSCSSEVFFVKFPGFLAFIVDIFFGYIHFHAGPCCRPQKYCLVVDLMSCMETSLSW